VVRRVSDSPSLTIATPAVVLEAARPGAFDPPDVLELVALPATLPELLTMLRAFVPKRRFRAAFAKTLVPVALVTVAAVSPAAAPSLEAGVLLLEPATPLLELPPPPVLPELLLTREPALLAPAPLLPNCSRLMVPPLALQGRSNALKSGPERHKLRVCDLKL
jgi:hypothetical protein